MLFFAISILLSKLNLLIFIKYYSGGGADFRPVIHYRDLDAPREPDEFL